MINMRVEALQLDEWIKMSEELDYLLTPEQYKAMEKDKKYKVVQIDFIRFLFQEAKRQNTGLKKRRIYDPIELFEKEKITPTMNIKIVNDDVIRQCDDCDEFDVNEEKIEEYEFISHRYGNKLNFDKVSDYKWLTTGNGDSFTRWMLYDNLKQMPMIYYKKPRDNMGLRDNYTSE